MTTKEVLVKARALIAKGWTQGVFARDKNGWRVKPNDLRACQWCATGALLSAAKIPHNLYGGEEIVKINRILNPIISYYGDYEGIGTFNDAEETTQADVLDVFDKAIARCDDYE